MERKNGGFTLIELLIAITVLSIMAAVLLQAFVVGRRINTKAGSDERIQDMARKTMEELKGVSLEALEELSGEEAKQDGKPAAWLAEGPAGEEREAFGAEIGPAGEEREAFGAEIGSAGEAGDWTSVSIAGTDYQFRESEDGKWELTTLYKKDGRPAKSGQADYLIRAVIDRQPYSEEAENVYSVNQFEMPNITDVSSFYNIVLEPEMISREEELLKEELLLQVNPQEDEDEGDESGEDEGAGGNREPAPAEGGRSSEEDEVVFDEGDIKRYLLAEVEEGERKVAVRIVLSYTAAESEKASESSKTREELTVEKEILNVGKKLAVDEKTGRVINRLYLFLPSAPAYEKLRILGSAGDGRQLEIYVISHQAGFVKNDIEFSSKGEPHAMFGSEENGWYRLYTNLDKQQPVSFSGAEDRLYHLTVAVYRALYPESGEGAEPGEMLLNLESTRRK